MQLASLLARSSRSQPAWSDPPPQRSPRNQQFPSRTTIVRGNAGLYYDRVPLRAVANALLSAGNTTDLGNLRQIAVSLSPNQAAAPVFPNILSTVVPSVTLVNFTTMDREMQNAYSRQASLEVERQFGRLGPRA